MKIRLWTSLIEHYESGRRLNREFFSYELEDMKMNDIKQWLDKRIDIEEELQKYRDFSEDIICCDFIYEHKIHIYSGLYKIADALGLEVTSRDCDYDGTIIHEVFYRGWTLFQIQSVGDDIS